MNKFAGVAVISKVSPPLSQPKSGAFPSPLLIMKNPARSMHSLFIWFVPALITSCGQPAEMTALKEKIQTAKSSNTARALELAQITQQLDLLKRQQRDEAGRVMEAEKVGKVSGETEQMITKYRKDIDVQLKSYQDDIVAYRKAYLNP